MKLMKHVSQRLASAALVLVVIAITPSFASGQFIWDGGGADDDWSTDANWAGGTAPAFSVGDELQFDGSTRLSPNADTQGWTDISGITFSAGADSFTLGGEALTLDDAATINQITTNNQTINNNIIAGGSSLNISLANNAGATLTLGGDVDLDNGGAGATLDVADLGVLQIDGVISGAGDINMDAASSTTLLLNGDNTFTGGVTLGDGTLAIGHDNALGTGTLTFNGGSGSIGAANSDRTVTNNVDLVGGSLLVNGISGHALTLDGQISGAGSLRLTGSPDVTINGDNDFTGGVQLNSGTLRVGHDNALGTGDLDVTADSTLTADGGDRTLANNVSLGTGDTLVISGSNNLTLNGVVTGDGAMSKLNAGTLTLTGDNTFAGGLSLNSGEIAVGHDNALGTGTLSVTGPGTLSADGGSRTLENDIALTVAGPLTIDGTENLTLNGTIAGSSGELAKTGAGTLQLNGDNTYDGDTTLSAGTLALGSDSALGSANETAGSLIVDGDATLTAADDTRTLSNDITLNTGNTLTIDGTDDLFLGGVISGDGALTQNGLATTVLAETNTYTGGTSLVGGGIHVQADNALGDGDVTVAGLGGILSTDEQVALDNNFTLDAPLAIQMASEDDSVTLTSSSVLSGTNDLTKAGPGLLELADDSGASSGYTGTIDIAGGTLALNREVGGDMNLNNGTLMGAGTIGGNLVASGGTIAPGNSIDEMTIGGDFTLDSDAVLEIELDGSLAIDPGVSHDHLDVGGGATLAEGSTIAVTADNGEDISNGDSFTLITTVDGVTDNGTNLSVVGGSALLELIADPDFTNGDNTYAVVAQAFDFASPAVGGNNEAIGSALTSLAEEDDPQFLFDLKNILDVEGTDEYNQALGELSPNVFDAPFAANVETTRSFLSALNGRQRGWRSGSDVLGSLDASPMGPSVMLASASAGPETLAFAVAQAEANRDAEAAEGENGDTDGDAINRRERPVTQQRGHRDESGWSVYGRGFGTFADRDPGSSRPGYRADVGGALVSIDYQYNENWLAGFSFGGSRTDLDLRDGRGEIDTTGFRVGPYASYSRGPWFVDGSLTAGIHDNESERNMPSLGETTNAEYDAWDITAQAVAGYDYEMSLFTLSPHVALQYQHYDQEAFTEQGDSTALAVDSREVDSLRSRLGVQAFTTVDFSTITFVPEGHIGWEHEYLGSEDFDARFAAGGDPFTISGPSPQRDAVVFGGGVSALLSEDLSTFVRYDGSIYDKGDTHTVSAGVRFRF